MRNATRPSMIVIVTIAIFALCVFLFAPSNACDVGHRATRAADAYEPNNDAGNASAIGYGSIYPTIYPTGDADYFNITVPSLGTLYVQVTNVPSVIDVVLYVYGPNSSTTQRAYANSYSSGGNEFVYFDCQPGYYIIRIYDYGNDHSSDTTYNLTTTFTAVLPDAYEPNNDAANASAITPGNYYPTIFPSLDYDWFNLTFVGYGTLSVTISNVPSTLNPVLRIYGPNSSTTQKAYADSYGYGGSEYIYTDIVPGYYYIRVYSYYSNDFSTSSYNLSIAFGNCSPDIYEPNNIDANACPIAPGNYYPTIFPTGDVDWYNITFDSMGTLSVQISNVSSRLDPVLAIYGPNSSTTQVGYADSGSSGAGEYLYVQVYAGYYYVRVLSYGNDDFSTQPYNLSVIYNAVSGDAYESNNNAEEAYNISSGTYTPTIFPKGDIDWFNISAAMQGTLYVYVYNVPSNIDPVITVYGPNSSTTQAGYADAGSGGSSEVVYIAVTPGYYYVRIYSYGNDDFSTGTYTLQITFNPVPPDPWEPNNDFSNACNISSGTYTPQIFPKGDNDYFNISCPTQGVLYVNVTNVPSSLDPVIYVYGPNSTTVRAYVDGGSGGSAELLYIDVLPGYYYVRVYSYGNDDFSTANYTLQISYMPIAPDMFEPNNDFGNASALDPGAYNLMIFPHGDKEYFNFSLPGQAKVYINVTQVSSRLDIAMALYGPNATSPSIISVNYYSYGGSEYLYRELGPGFYYVYIYSLGSADFSTSPYRLSFETNLPTVHNDAGTGADAGNNFTYATAIPLGNYLGNISNEDTNDYYIFPILPNEALWVNFTSPSSGGCYLYVYDAQQTDIAGSTSVPNGASYSLLCSPQPSFIFVRIQWYSGLGTYRLNVTSWGFQNDASSGCDAGNNMTLAYAPSIALGSYSGLVCYGDNNDYFIYNLLPNEAVYVNFSSISCPIYVYIYDSLGTDMAGSTSIPIGSSYSILYSPRDVYFYIRIARSSSYGTYGLSIERWGFQDDASTGADAGNNFTYAAQPGLGAHIGLLCIGDNYDYYQFPLAPAQVIYVNLSSQLSGGAYIYIYNSAYAEMTNSYVSSGGTSSIMYTNTDDRFYVRVLRSSGTGTYRLNVTSFGHQDDAGTGSDAGNNFTYSENVALGDYSGMVCLGDDNDYYNFSLAPNEVVYVNLTAPSSSNLYMYVYDTSNSEITNRYVSSGATQTILYSSGQSHFFVRVYRSSGNGVYRMNVTHYCFQDDAGTGGDGPNTLGAAANISYGSHLGMMCFADDNDYFAIAMTGGATVYTNITAPSTMSLYIYLYNAVGTQLYSGYCTSGGSLSAPQTYASDGIMKIRIQRSSGTGIYSLSVNNAVNPPPTLAQGSVSPSSGETTTTFTFSVNYTDGSNLAPAYVRVFIDGTSHEMTKQNPGDSTYTDGCIYAYSTMLTSGTHSYYFEASNGLGASRLPSTGTYSGPGVGVPNSSPSLSAGEVTPLNGNTATSFAYSVIYTDPDNDAPSYVRVYIDGTSHEMTKQNPGDSTYTDGCVYMYSTTLSSGSHDYYFTTSDGALSARLPETGTYGGPYVTTANTAPVLSASAVNPTTAIFGTNVTYSVTYTDNENAAPTSVLVYIDGTIHTMVKQDYMDATYTDGCIYIYWTSTLSVGSHNYYFECSDGQLQARLPSLGTFSGPTISPANVAPVLASGSVSPPSAIVGSSFTYSLSYSDADNDAPSYVRVYIDGTSHDMSKQDASDVTYTDGCAYIFTTSLSLGNHNYYFECSDGELSTRLPSSGTYSGPAVTSEPLPTPLVLISEVMYDPLGTESYEEWFELYNPGALTAGLTGFYVRDNSGVFFLPSGTTIPAGGTIIIARNATAFYARYGFAPQISGCNLSLSNSGDVLRLYSSDGVEVDMVAWESYIAGWTCYANENFTIERCPAGQDTNSTADWISNSVPSPGTVCTPNAPPSAVVLGLPTNVTTSSMSLYWSMNNDADFAKYEVHKSSTASFTPDASTLVTTINVRATTSYTAIGLSPSTTYYFKVRVFDTGALYADSNEVSGMTHGTNTPPSLTLPGVSPSSGIIDDTFTFTVTYTDAEDDHPAYVRVYIDGVMASMQKADLLDDTYYDGCVYEYIAIGTLAIGTHSYYFEASDGLEVALNPPSGSLSGPVISQPGNNAPMLSANSVTPISGDTSTTFTYRVTYTDADGDEPAFVRIFIDGTSHDMSKENSADNDYTDGCVYLYSTTLPAGSHNYNFATNDTKDPVRFPLNGDFLGPSVSSIGNSAPVLENGNITPNSGNPTTIFKFSVTYKDADDHAPSYVRVVIDGASHEMTKTNSGDNVYYDGCLYEFSTTLLPGYHQYHFEASDGIDNASTGTKSTGLVSFPNSIPSLAYQAVAPESGTTSTIFEYRITYFDADNQAPAYVKVYIDGTDHDMGKEDVFDTSYSNGCIYKYSTSLPVGSHTYRFLCSDGQSENSTAVFSGPSVVPANEAPTLSSAQLSPMEGNTTTSFTFSITYVDANDDAPTYMILVLDGEEYQMEKAIPGDYNYIDGCTYIYTTTLAKGVHSYSFKTSDGMEFSVFPEEGAIFSANVTQAAVPMPNRAPALSLPTLSPSGGDPRTPFTFRVYYSDPDGDKPAYVRVIVDGKAYEMIGPANADYRDNVQFELVIKLAKGKHNHYFSASDGEYVNNTMQLSGPKVVVNQSTPGFSGALVMCALLGLGAILVMRRRM